MNARIKIALLYALSFVATAAPLVTAIVINRGEYIKTPSDAVKLTFGGIIAAFFVLMKVLGKLRMPRGVTLYTLIFVLAYLFDAVLDDLMLLSGMALLGEVIDVVFFRPLIRRAREGIMVDATADATATQVEAMLDRYLGGKNGRENKGNN